MSSGEKGCWVRVATEGRRVPSHCGLAYVEGGEVFMPAEVVGNPNAMLMKAMFDGVSAVFSDGHGYYPMSWLKSEYPAHAEQLARIEAKIKAVAEKGDDA